MSLSPQSLPPILGRSLNSSMKKFPNTAKSGPSRTNVPNTPRWSILAATLLVGVEERMILSRRRRVRGSESEEGLAQISSLEVYVRKAQLSPRARRPSVTQSRTPRLAPCSPSLPSPSPSPSPVPVPSLANVTSKTCFCAYPLPRKGWTGSGARRRPAPVEREAVRF